MNEESIDTIKVIGGNGEKEDLVVGERSKFYVKKKIADFNNLIEHVKTEEHKKQMFNMFFPYFVKKNGQIQLTLYKWASYILCYSGADKFMPPLSSRENGIFQLKSDDTVILIKSPFSIRTIKSLLEKEQSLALYCSDAEIKFSVDQI